LTLSAPRGLARICFENRVPSLILLPCPAKKFLLSALESFDHLPFLPASSAAMTESARFEKVEE
jgi:hypothetical protein